MGNKQRGVTEKYLGTNSGALLWTKEWTPPALTISYLALVHFGSRMMVAATWVGAAACYTMWSK